MKGSEVICSWGRVRDEQKKVGEGHKMEVVGCQSMLRSTAVNDPGGEVTEE